MVARGQVVEGMNKMDEEEWAVQASSSGTSKLGRGGQKGTARGTQSVTLERLC